MDFILTEVLKRIKIDALNPMQQEMWAVGEKNNDMILLSPTGSGKTLAYMFPLCRHINIDSD